MILLDMSRTTKLPAQDVTEHDRLFFYCGIIGVTLAFFYITFRLLNLQWPAVLLTFVPYFALLVCNVAAIAQKKTTRDFKVGVYFADIVVVGVSILMYVWLAIASGAVTL